MQIDTHSVVYFINEEYGVVIKVNGATKEVAMWEPKRQCFAKRMDLVTASFLARVDRSNGRWCSALPTYNLLMALSAAAKLTPKLPTKEQMRKARAEKLRAISAELDEKSASKIAAEIIVGMKERETKYAGI